MAEHLSLSPGTLPPTVRLQVWHRSDYRRSYRDNKSLEEAIRRAGIQDWMVEAARLENDHNIGDDFVPIEVNLQCQNRDLAVASASLRELFVLTARTLSVELLEGRESKPLFVNAFPIGDGALDAVRPGFTHLKVLKSLAVESQPCAKTCPTAEQDLVAELICIGLEAPRHTLGFLKIYLEVRFGGIPSLKHVEESIRTLKQEMDNGILSGHVQGCVESLSKGQAISNQDLLDNLIMMRRAVVHLSKYQMNMRELTEPLLTIHGNDARLANKKTSMLVGAAAALSCVLGFKKIGGSFLYWTALTELSRTYLAFHRQDTVRELDDAMVQFSQSLQRVQVALAVQFCDQVLGARLDCLSIAERTKTLKDLGVDVLHLEPQQLSNDLVIQALQMHDKLFGKFKAKRDQVRDHAGLKEFATVELMDDEDEE
ncbi:hypothetical protein ACHAPT_012748 [Fusarium lateritium]